MKKTPAINKPTPLASTTDLITCCCASLVVDALCLLVSLGVETLITLNRVVATAKKEVAATREESSEAINDGANALKGIIQHEEEENQRIVAEYEQIEEEYNTFVANIMANDEQE